MQNSLNSTSRFYSISAISLATFLGGPIAAGLLMRRNFINTGQEKYAMITLLLGVLATLLVIGVIFVIPDSFFSKPGANAIIPGIYTALIYLIAEKLQGGILLQHKENLGLFYSKWRAAGIGLIFTIATLLFIFGAILAEEHFNRNFDAAAFDTRIEKFVENETKSLIIFHVAGRLNDELLLPEYVHSKDLWSENLVLADEMTKIERLPEDLLQLAQKLKEYSRLRISMFDLIMKGVYEKTEVYNQELDQVIEQINLLIEEIS
jgi:hypothetical protein